MFSLLLAIIYVAFISLGLPDSMLGAGWPQMQQQLGVPLSSAGIITMIIAGGTIISSLLSEKITRKWGAGLVTAVSVLLTAIALLGFSLSQSFVLLCVLAVPYGLGAGAVDAALNNYVALHYSSKHMNWLHCAWGVGASVSPYIMSFCLTKGFGWRGGYFSVSMLQIVLCMIIFISIPLWKRQDTSQVQQADAPKNTSVNPIKINGVKFILVAFFGYCALEATTGLWTSSYLIQVRQVPLETAASFTALFFLGITGGRFLCGWISERIGDARIIRIGIGTILFGLCLILLPLETDFFALTGFIIMGFGCAPIYPAIIHSTPGNFGAENSQGVIGIEIASAYVGTTFMPPLFGWLAEKISMVLFPYFLLVLAVLMLVMFELLQKCLRNAHSTILK